jgi:ATP-dependent DNA helicase RecG
MLAKVGIETVADLLHHVPYRYIDRRNRVPIAETPLGEEVTVLGEVLSARSWSPRRKLTIVEAQVGDESGRIKAVWFNQKWRLNQLQSGTQVALSGVVESFRGGRQMKSPGVDILGKPSEGLVTGRVVPLHTRVSEVKAGYLRRGIHNALRRSRPIPDPVPAEFIKRHSLIDRDSA